MELVTTREHYEALIREGDDPFSDPPFLQEYMSRWDGPAFYQALGFCQDKRVLEVGVGTGRVAYQVLQQGCSEFVGIDISPTTLERARQNLVDWPAHFLLADAQEYKRENSFDVAYSVLTFMHIPNKGATLANMVASLVPGGHLVLSLTVTGDWLEYNTRRLKLYPSQPEDLIHILVQLGCQVESKPLYDPSHSSKTAGEQIATLIKAVKTGGR